MPTILRFKNELQHRMGKVQFELEVCVDRMHHAMQAAEAGATRIEFNTALSLGGLTPSIEQCRLLVADSEVPIVAMLRPHAYNFCYSKSEELCLLRECSALLETGVAGIVFGQLDDFGRIDLSMLGKLSELCQERELILHRAFDDLDDQLEATPAIIDAGVKRILTSGGATTALEGCRQLRSLQQNYGSQVEILPGAGVTTVCLDALIKATSCNQFHGSFRCGGQAPDYQEIRGARQILEQAFGESSGD